MVVAQDRPIAAVDGFDFDDQIGNQGNTHPFAQLLNPSDGIVVNGELIRQPHGFGIKKENAIAVGIDEEVLKANGWDLVEYTFTGDKVEDFYVTRQPRFAVVHNSVVYVTNKENKKVIGKFDAKTYNPLTQQTFTDAFFFVLGKNNEILHSPNDEGDVIPLKIRLKGAAGAKFSTTWKGWDNKQKIQTGFISDLEAAYAKARGWKSVKRMNAVFWAHGVFAPTVGVAIAGKTKDQQKPVCDFAKYLVPDPTNLGLTMIANGTPDSDIIKLAVEKFKDYKPSLSKENAAEDEFTSPAPPSFAAPNIDDEDDYPPY